MIGQWYTSHMVYRDVDKSDGQIHNVLKWLSACSVHQVNGTDLKA